MAVFWWNAGGAFAAAVANLYAVKAGDPKLAALRAAIAALAAFYLAGYLLVTLGGWDVGHWGEFYRKAAVITWPVVWVAPAVLGARNFKRTTRSIKNLGERRE